MATRPCAPSSRNWSRTPELSSHACSLFDAPALPPRRSDRRWGLFPGRALSRKQRRIQVRLFLTQAGLARRIWPRARSSVSFAADSASPDGELRRRGDRGPRAGADRRVHSLALLAVLLGRPRRGMEHVVSANEALPHPTLPPRPRILRSPRGTGTGSRTRTNLDRGGQRRAVEIERSVVVAGLASHGPRIAELSGTPMPGRRAPLR